MPGLGIGEGVWLPQGMSIFSASGGSGGGSTPPPLNPTDWWDPDLSAFQDTGKTTPAIANNDPIAVLGAQVGGLGDFANAAGSVRPLLKTNSLNAHSTFLFDGVDDKITQGTTINGFTMVFAVNVIVWTNLAEMWGSISNGRSRIVMSSASPGQKFVTATGGASAQQNTLAVATWGIISVQLGAAAGTYRVNNNARVSLTDDNTTTFNGTSFGVAYNLGFSNIQVGRIAYYNTRLSQGDEDTVVTAFATYYGLSI